MNSRKIPLYQYRFFIWAIPLLVFIVLMAGNLWAWYNTSGLISRLVRVRALNAAQQMFLRLDLVFYERTKDLNHLATVVAPTDQFALDRFVNDAAGILSRESSFESIGYIDTTGRIVVSVPDTAPGLMVLDRKRSVEKLLIRVDGPIATEVYTLPSGESVQGILVPVAQADDSVRRMGAVAGMLNIETVVENTVAQAIVQGFNVSIVVDSVEVYSDSSEVSRGNGISLSKSILGKNWTITLFPEFTGELEQLGYDNFYRLLLNTFASLIASVLLAVALVGFHRAGLNRRELAASEQRYRRLTENARDMVFRITLPSGKYEYVSPAAYALTGFAADDFYLRPNLLRSLIDRNWLDYYDKSFDKLLRGEIDPVYEFPIINKNGERRWVHLRPVLVKDDRGRPCAVEAIATDITLLKNAMDERGRLIKELEGKNAELERYAYTISHELKTPLITIRGFLGYLEKEAAEGDISSLHQDLTLIQSATDTMQRLLEGLIELTRVGRASDEAENVPLGELVQISVDHFQQKIKEKGIRVEVASDMPVVYGHRAELLELIQNLLENSIKFTGDQKEPVIRFGWCTEEGITTFFVEDNGLGIDPKYKNRIFGIFAKLDPSSEGAGVGLALSQRIVTFHGGTIRAESEGRGKGMRICFTLPLAKK